MTSPEPDGPAEDDRARYICDWTGCNKSYIRHEHLTRHQLNHKGFGLECRVCHKQFNRNDLLRRHMTRHERGEDEFEAPRKRAKTEQAPGSGASRSGQVGTPARYGSVASLVSEHNFGETPAGYPTTPLTDYPPGPIGASEYAGYSDVRSFPSPAPSSHRVGNGHYGEQYPQPPKAETTSPFDPFSPIPPSFLPAQQSSGPANSTLQGHGPDASYSPRFADPTSGVPNNPPDADYSWLFSNVNGGGLFDEPIEFGSFIDLQSDILSQYTDNSMDTPGRFSRFQISPFTHATLLSKLPQELHNQPYVQLRPLEETLETVLDSLDLIIPMFHRPTFLADHLTMPLLLALVSYGFMMYISQQDIYSAGLLIHQNLRRILFDPDINPSTVDLMFLQAMLVHELSGTFLGRRLEHEKSDVLHGQLITLARRSSLLMQETTTMVTQQSSKLRAEERWFEWIRRETTKRLAHFIFCHDVQQHVFFNHNHLMVIEDMKLAMPCNKLLWEASLSQWSSLHRQNARLERDSRRFHRDFVLAFVMEDHDTIESARFDALHQYLVVHGLLSLVTIHAERKSAPVMLNQQASSGSTLYNSQAERLILNNALLRFESAIDKTTRVDAAETIDVNDIFARNTRVLLRLAKVELQIYGPDMEICAGSMFSGGRAVNPTRVEHAWRRMTDRRLSLEMTFPALENIQNLCSVYRNSDGSLSYGSTGNDIFQRTLGGEMLVPTCLYSAALAIWTYSIASQREAGKAVDIQYGRYDPETYRWLVQSTSKDPREVAKLCDEFRHRDPDDIDKLKELVRKLMVLVSERISSSRSGITIENRSVIVSLCH